MYDKKLSYVGMLRKNKVEIPKEFLPNKNRKPIVPKKYGIPIDFKHAS